MTTLRELSGWATRRGQLRGLVLIAITAGIFALLFRQIDLGAVVGTLRTISAPVWILATFLTISFPVFSALRWRLSLRAIGHEVSFRRCLTIILGTSPVSAVAPSKAGDLLKAVSFRGEIGVLEVGGTVLTERALDVIALAALSLLGGLLVGFPLVTRIAAIVTGLGIIGLLLLPALVSTFPKPALREKLERVIQILRSLRQRPALAAGMVFFTVINWLASIVQTHFLLHAVGAPVPFHLTMAALPIAIFIGLIPVTLGGMGTRDAALITLLTPAVSAPQALAVGLLYSFFGYWLLALLGLPFLKAALPRSFQNFGDPARGRRRRTMLHPPPVKLLGSLACKICGQGPLIPRHEVQGIVYYHCTPCDFLQNFHWEDRKHARAAEEQAENDEARVRLWAPGDPEHERNKGWEILGLMASPVAWRSRNIHAALKRVHWYRQWHENRLRRFLPRLLDFGCGQGTIVAALRGSGFDCIGLDPFALPGTPHVLRTSLTETHLPAESFAGIFSIETMEHLTDVLGTFRGLQRLLRPGGILLVQSRRLEDPDYRAQGDQWFYLREPTTHVSIYSETALRRIAEKTGFRSVQFRGVKFARFVK